ncbi:MAG: NAD(P)H-binding protein [Rhodobacteraceae bacterium]|nr:NAD(P)H-binding protein [Paracoccaceae bacterium]
MPARTIALFGATGRAGGRVLGRLLARGDRVRALARDPARLAPAPGLAVLAGDAGDQAAVAATLAGADAVIATLGMADISTPSTAFSDAVRVIVGAMQNGGPRRLVMIAGAGTLPHPEGGFRADRNPPGPYSHVAAEHVRNFRTLAASGLDWTLFCPGNLIAGEEEGYETRPEDWPGQPGRPTRYAALAAALVAALDRPDWIGHRMGIASV